ncbi:MAG: hypothetical protein ACJA2S_003615 [Cyclobacteriaceae bacterium]|jgi:hypothetical protein
MRNSHKFLLTLIFLVSAIATGLSRQNFGNEWIDYNQEYFKISIVEDGIYRLTYDDLNNAGFPVNSVIPNRIQLFYKGVELAIKVKAQQDGKFDPADYLEFYAVKNDGTSDTELYINPDNQPHTYYNLFSDVSSYFLTYKLSNENGKRIGSFFENNVDNIPEEERYKKEILQLFTSSYSEGESYGSTNDIVLSQYDNGEGWTGSFASRGQTLSHTLAGITNPIQSGDKPNIEILLAGGNNNAHSAEIFVGASTAGLRSIGTANFNKDDIFLFTSEVEWSDVSTSGELVVSINVNGVDGAADRIAISYIKLEFDHSFDLSNEDNQKITLNTNSAGKSFLRINNPLINSQLWDITDLNTPISIGTNSSFQELTAIASNTAQGRTLYIQSQNLIAQNIENVVFEKINPQDYNYIIVSNELLRSSTSSGTSDAVEAYKAYRESDDGGGYKVLVANMSQLYDQFNYGLIAPLAIRRFCNFMLSTSKPEHLFLIGRATNNNFDYFRQDAATAVATNFVPTFGHPGADIAITSGLNGTTLQEAIPTGRINAKSPDDVEAYLNKVIETESLVYNELWHKNILHLTGGANESELVRFRSYGEQFESTAVGPFLGGLVSKASKKTSDAVEFFNITKEINNGVGLINFFGHSGASVTDIEIGIVSDPAFGFDNKGKYPIFIVNGCNAGDFFGVNESFGIDWILTPDLGAVGFMAHSGLAFSNNLRNYTNLFYKVAYNDESFFSESLGVIKQEVSKRYTTIYGTGAFSSSQVQQFILQGDPAIKVFAANKPDFEIQESNLKIGTYDGSPLLSEVDSFYVDLDIINYGKYSSDPFYVTIKRTLPNGSELTYGPELITPILRQDTIRIKINNQLEGVNGNNNFRIILDEDDTIEELDESNNTASFDLFLATGSTFNILPQNYSTQTSSVVDFFFQSTNLLSGKREFLFEIDTISSFNSHFLIQQSVTEHVIAKLTIDLESRGNLPEGTEVFWRTKFAKPLPSEIDDWVLSSFTLESSGQGWSQSDNDQLNNIQRNGLTFDTNTGLWDFLSNDLSIDINTFGPSHPSGNHTDTKLLLDGSNFYETNAPSDPGCRTNTLNIIAFDFQSTVPYKPQNYGQQDVLNNRICGKAPQNIYNFTEAEFVSAINPETLIDNIKEKDKVLIFSLGFLNYSTWSTSLKAKLGQIGINQSTLDNLQDGEPVIFLGTKGETAGSAIEVLATSEQKQEQEIQLNSVVSGSFFSGYLTSEKIGPALSYDVFSNNLDLTNQSFDETYSFDIIGIDDQNTESILFGNIQSSSTDLSSINVDTYPYLKIVLKLEDRTDLSPLQLKKWRIEYEPAPEGILLKRSNEGLETPIVIQEGQPFDTGFTFWNISKTDYSDSIKVNFNLFNRASRNFYADSLNLLPIKANDSVNFNLAVNTIDRNGKNDLNIKVNDSEQLEVHLNNNNIGLTKYLEINPDSTNPILEVSFDGVFILDGDIVSPSPFISIIIKDENQYLLKEDTTGIDLFIKEPCEKCDFERVAFSNPNLMWQPATEETDFNIEYSPSNLADGIYAIRVQANDASGNDSGTEPYEINFEIINESTVTNFYPYPNPFSSSTRFVFTLTGSEIPEDIKIQIMTISGRVVREILREELGAIRIGNNISDFAWDGRDEYGDQLANGTYFYKVYIQKNGQEITHRNSGGDQGFKNGFGKIQLLR